MYIRNNTVYVHTLYVYLCGYVYVHVLVLCVYLSCMYVDVCARDIAIYCYIAIFSAAICDTMQLM